MIARSAASLALAASVVSLATAGALTFLSMANAAPASTPEAVIERAFEAVAAKPAPSPELQAAMGRAVKADRQPVEGRKQTVTVELRSGEAESTLVRIPVTAMAQR